MQPGSFSFLHFSPLRNWFRLIRAHEQKAKTFGTIFLVLVIVLHTTLGHLAYFDAHAVAIRTVKTRPFRSVSANTTGERNYVNIVDAPANGSAYSPSDALRPVYEKDDGVVKLLVVAYYRSGYNVIGASLEQYPDSFYWSEPLYGLFNAFYKRSGARRSMAYNGYDVNSLSRTNQTGALQDLALRTISDILDCNMTSLSRDVIEQNYLYTSTNPGIGSYKTCLQQQSARLTSERKRQCRPLLEAGCDASGVRSVKTTRLSLRLVARLMSRDPDLKVIYTVRDPRLMMKSRNVPLELLGQVMSSTCSAILQDLETYKTIIDAYPNRIFLIKAEDVSNDPSHWVEQVLTFAGLKYENGNGISKIATVGSSYIHSVVSGWNDRFTAQEIMNMQIDCQDVFSYLDYNIVYV